MKNQKPKTSLDCILIRLKVPQDDCCKCPWVKLSRATTNKAGSYVYGGPGGLIVRAQCVVFRKSLKVENEKSVTRLDVCLRAHDHYNHFLWARDEIFDCDKALRKKS